MNEIVEAFRRLIPIRHRKTGRDWMTFDCPSCGDRRGRGGFLETPNGGFRYRCQNGGCEFERGTGWEPGNGFLGRPRRLFQQMGGSISDIPQALLDPSLPVLKSFTPDQRDEWLSYMMGEESEEAYRVHLQKTPEDEDLAMEFPSIEIPEGSVILWDAKDKNAVDVQRYVLDRCRSFIDREPAIPFLWSPKFKRHVIVPFIYHHRIIGWIGRKVDPGKDFAHIKCPKFPSDYMLNQDIMYRFPTVLVVEGTFDAIALKALGTFGNVVSKKQTNLLNHLKDTGRRIALLPDFKKDEWCSYLISAKKHGWHLCVPEYPGDDGYSLADYIKDPGDSIKRNGLLYTMEVVMKSITNDYDYAEQLLLRRSR